MAKRKLELTQNSNQKDDSSILRTLKKLTSAVHTVENNSSLSTSTEAIKVLEPVKPTNNEDDNLIITPVLTQASIPVITKALTPVETPVLTPALNNNNLNDTNSLEVIESSPTIESNQQLLSTQLITKPKKKYLQKSKQPSNNLLEMAKWHTEAEQKVYKAIYEETKAHNTKELYFTFLSLSELTGFRNPRTIRAALLGLVAKKSIEEILNKHGNHLGIRYKVFSPEEIIQRRIESNINIDFQSKKIL